MRLVYAGRLALDRQHIKCQGRTPEATMASALYTDVKRKGNKSVFTRYNHPIVLYKMCSRGIKRESSKAILTSPTSPECMAMT